MDHLSNVLFQFDPFKSFLNTSVDLMLNHSKMWVTVGFPLAKRHSNSHNTPSNQ